MIEVITFDLDDTLWSVDSVISRAEQQYYDWLEMHASTLTERFSLDELRNRRLDFYRNNPRYQHKISQLRIDALASELRLLGYDTKDADTLANNAFTVFLDARHDIELFPDAVAVLPQLAQHYRLGALTNGNADFSRLPLAQWLEFGFTAEQLNASKPAADHFQAAMAVTGVPASAIVHVGDHPEHDVLGAIAAGCHAVWYNPNQQPWQADQPTPTEIRSLLELPDVIRRLERAGPQT